jgi:hypothetical protein
MEADERFQAICFVVMIILEIILIIMLVSKIRRELKYAGTNRRMTAMVESVRKTRISSKLTVYSFIVKARNGKTYEVCGSGLRASMIARGDIVQIFVPDGYVGMDEHFESIVSGGKEAIRQLSDSEKESLSEYFKERINSICANAEMMKFPTLISEGGGEKSEILHLLIITLFFAVVIIITACAYLGIIT